MRRLVLALLVTVSLVFMGGCFSRSTEPVHMKDKEGANRLAPGKDKGTKKDKGGTGGNPIAKPDPN
jgi:hypothetical protein